MSTDLTEVLMSCNWFLLTNLVASYHISLVTRCVCSVWGSQILASVVWIFPCGIFYETEFYKNCCDFLTWSCSSCFMKRPSAGLRAGIMLPSFYLEDQSLPLFFDLQRNGLFFFFFYSLPVLTHLPGPANPPSVLSSSLCLFFGHGFQRCSPPHPHEILTSSLKEEPQTVTQTITQSCNRCSHFPWGRHGLAWSGEISLHLSSACLTCTPLPVSHHVTALPAPFSGFFAPLSICVHACLCVSLFVTGLPWWPCTLWQGGD